ncbi:hypothetical protein [Baekduia sp. Peel2402]|uniref:hypothetical protein n=1 Tax=Baekduia sp. Peel2402 TaxID=3458296 RepID=UPI00403E8CCB
MSSALRTALPFAAFAVFMGYFTLRARRDGTSTREWINRRNRRAFTTPLKPGWWIPYVVFAAAAWTVMFVVSGFKLVLLAALPVVVLWVPLMTLAFRWFYGRTGER